MFKQLNIFLIGSAFLLGFLAWSAYSTDEVGHKPIVNYSLGETIEFIDGKYIEGRFKNSGLVIDSLASKPFFYALDSLIEFIQNNGSSKGYNRLPIHFEEDKWVLGKNEYQVEDSIKAAHEKQLNLIASNSFKEQENWPLMQAKLMQHILYKSEMKYHQIKSNSIPMKADLASNFYSKGEQTIIQLQPFFRIDMHQLRAEIGDDVITGKNSLQCEKVLTDTGTFSIPVNVFITNSKTRETRKYPTSFKYQVK